MTQAGTIIASRKHSNGWTAVVRRADDGDILTADALSPAGESHSPGPGASINQSLAEAKEDADRFVEMATGHGPQCDCPSWR